jgi:hypothetical protein
MGALRAFVSSTSAPSLSRPCHTFVQRRRAGNVPGVENYQRHPGKNLERVLATCDWKEVSPGLWWKGNSRLYVDAVGVFLYRQTNGAWAKTRGLSHNRIFLLKSWQITFLDKSTLNLLDGEWNGMDRPVS